MKRSKSSSPQCERCDQLEAELRQLRAERDQFETINQTLTSVQDELEVSREQYADLYDSAPVGYLTLDGNGCIRRANVTAAKMLNAGAAGVIDKPLIHFIRSTDHRAFNRYVTRLRLGAEHISTELTLDGRGGEPVVVQLLSERVPDAEHPVQGKRFRAILVDITDRRRAEVEAGAERSVLNAIMESTDVKLVFLDCGFNFVAVNPAYAATCKMTPEEMVGKNHFDLFPNEENEAIFRRVRDSGQAVSFHDKLFEYPDQPERGVTYWDWTLTPVKDDAGQVTGLVFSLNETTDRKRAEETLRTVALFPEQNCAPVLRISREGELLYTNPAGVALVESWDCARGKPVPKTISTAVRRALDRDEAVEIENTCQDVVYSLSVVPITSDGYANLYGYDITERKIAEETLSESREQFKIMGEAVDYGVWLCDKEGKAVYASQSFLDLLDMTMEQMQGFGWTHRLAPEDVEPTIERWLRCVETGEPWDSEHRIIDRHGRMHTILTRGKPVRDNDGNIVSWAGINLDITQRKETERALVASEQRYRSLFNGMTEGFALHEIVCDEAGRPRDYRFLDLNPAFEQLTGLDRQGIAGKLVSEILPDEANQWIDLYAPVALEGRSVHFDEYSPGLDKHFEIFAYRPAPGQFAVLFLDISERVGARRDLEEANVKLQEQTEELASINEELQSQAEALQLQAGELTTANEELRTSEQSLVARSKELEAVTAALENEKLRLEAVLDALPVGMALTDAQGGVLRANRAFEQVWAGPYPPTRSARDYHAYKAWWADSGDVLAPSEWASIQAVHKRVPVVGQFLEIERFDGSHGFVLNSASPVHDATGGIVGAAVAIQDITDLRRAQEQVRDSEQRLRLALEGGRMAYWERNCADGASFWSESLYEMLGLDSETTTASTETLLSCVHPDDKDDLRRSISEAESGRNDFKPEFRIVRPDEKVVWLASRGSSVRDADGRALRMMGVIFDVSQRREMEAELRRLNEHLEEQVNARTDELAQTVETLREEVALRRDAEEALRERSRILEGFFQHTITPLAIMDRQFTLMRVNRAFAEAAGRDADAFVGKSFFEFYADDQHRTILEQVVQAKETYHAYAKPFDFAGAAPSSPSYWNWLLTPLLDETGHVELLVFNLEDVTERQAAFEELEARASQLQRMTLELSEAEDRERQRLAEVLHDDLQQLLVGAKLHLNILANRAGADEELGQVVTQVRTLISDAISRSRGLSHELSPPLLQQGGLGEVLNWLGQQMFTTCGLTVEVDAKSEVDLHSDALRTFAYKAAQEMLFNVVKHARVKRAKVELRRIAGLVRLLVSDEGQGFDPQQLTERRGTGFGLFSIQERVQLLGGWMKFKSAPGKGSVFVLAIPDGVGSDAEVIPAGAEVDLRSAVMTPPLRRLDSHLIRVLLVDDHKVMRQGVAALLEEEPDIEVIGQAGNGRDAVTLAEQLQPDVIVMDVAMPVLSGDEATRQIKNQLPSVRVIGLSISEPGAVSHRMLKAGAEAFLSKTDPSEKLIETIRGAKRKR